MLQPGEEVDRFVVETFLGEGGLSRVYRVRHRQLGSRYALKMLVIKGERLSRRLVREGRIQANLSHPNVVAVSDIVEHEGYTGLVMEFVEGRGLDQVLAASGAPPLDEALALFRQMLAGVAAAHDAGVLHRDLKPGNVLLLPRGEGVTAKVMDFGIAKLVMDEAPTNGDTLQSDVMGTPGYMAPEQADDPTAVDARADVYSLGAILYCLVTGRPPFLPGSLAEMMVAASQGRFPPVREVAPDVPERVALAVEACLDPDPAARPESCRALADRLYDDAIAFDAEVAGDRPSTLHVPGARSLPERVSAPVEPVNPAAATWSGGSAPTAVPESTPGDGPTLDQDAGPLPDPGQGGKWIFVVTATFVVLVLGGVVFETWRRTGSPLPDPVRAQAALEQRQQEAAAAKGDAAPAPAPAPAAPTTGSVDPGLGEPVDTEPEPLDLPEAGTPAPADPPPAEPPAAAAGEAPAVEPDATVAEAPPEPEGGDEADAEPLPVEPEPEPAAPDDEPEPAIAMAEAPPPEEPPVAEAPPEAPPAAALPDVTGTWTGKVGGRPFTIRVLSAQGGAVTAELEVLLGTTVRTFAMSGRQDGDRLQLAEPSGNGWQLDGSLVGGSLKGMLVSPGRKKGQMFTASR